jgi:4-alpha-glucanotransferase
MDPLAVVPERYVDAFDREARVDPAARRAVLRAMGLDPNRGARAARGDPGPVAVGAAGAVLASPAELVLEDGTSLGTVARLPRDLPYGYHHLLRSGRDQLLLVPPRRCASPSPARGWAWSVQLPSIRSAASWGMGDLGDLRRLAAWSHRIGAQAVVVSPLGAPNPSPEPEPSPYYPSTRRFRNPLLVSIGAVPGAAEAPGIEGLAADARRLNAAPLINRPRVAALKQRALAQIWQTGAALRDDTAASLRAFRERGGASLRRWAVFAALSETHGPGWQRWPSPLRRPTSRAVEAFATAHADRVAFHEWVQWLLDEQLRAAAGAGVAFINDLPVGFDPGGFDAWEWQELLASEARIGAPPDRFNPGGQDWGLPPFVPHRLREAHLAPFIETVRASLGHAGGLRIDHVMGLFRLWWIPGGGSGGAYVRYPVDELLAVLAIESRRAGAAIIGEDLGTVERGVRRTLSRRGLLSTRVVYFERRAPSRYPRAAYAAVTTHDLPTLAGVWQGTDLDDQRAAGNNPDPRDLERLRRRVARAAAAGPNASLEDVVLGVHRVLAASPASLVSATLEDALRVDRRPNLPGTTAAQRPNWSMALPAALEALERDPFVARLAEALHRP